MLDDELLREQLADWVRPMGSLPVPDIRVLRRRARRRGMRRASAAAASITAVVAVGLVISLPGAGRPAGGRPAASPSVAAPAGWGPAPGTWTHGIWRPAGPAPAADAGPATAPYVVMIVPGRGLAEVRSPFTGKVIATVQPPADQGYSGVAAAGDDRTFVLETLVGWRPGPYSTPPRSPTGVAFYELRLAPDGRLESVGLLFSLRTTDAPLFFAVSQDASMLAYTTDTGGLEAVSLATATGRSWSRADGGQASLPSLSWAGDRTLAFELVVNSRPWDQPAYAGVRLLDVTALGTMLQASRLVIRYSRYCASFAVCRDDPLITPDGTAVLVTEDVVSPGSTGGYQRENYTGNVEEISTRTGRVVTIVAPALTLPFPGPLCEPLWTDPSGDQVVSYYGYGAQGHYETYNDGHVSPVKLSFPWGIVDFGGARGSNAFAW